jgi:hypothetical protein
LKTVFNNDENKNLNNLFDNLKNNDMDNIFNIFKNNVGNATISNINNVPKDDVASTVTNSVSIIIKNNLCSTLGNGANNLCENISSNVISNISGLLNSVIKSSIKSDENNSLSIACSNIPSKIFTNLSSAITSGIYTEVAKNGGDAQEVRKVTNNIITIIINTINSLICSDGSKDNGSVVFDDASDLINTITNKVRYMSNNVFSNLINGYQLAAGSDRNIAINFSDIQNSIKMQYKSFNQQANKYKNY